MFDKIRWNSSSLASRGRQFTHSVDLAEVGNIAAFGRIQVLFDVPLIRKFEEVESRYVALRPLNYATEQSGLINLRNNVVAVCVRIIRFRSVLCGC